MTCAAFKEVREALERMLSYEAGVLAREYTISSPVLAEAFDDLREALRLLDSLEGERGGESRIDSAVRRWVHGERAPGETDAKALARICEERVALGMQNEDMRAKFGELVKWCEVRLGVTTDTWTPPQPPVGGEQCDHKWSAPSKDASPVVCLTCGVPKVVRRACATCGDSGGVETESLDANGHPIMRPCPECSGGEYAEFSKEDWEEVLADHRRLVRDLDVLLNGQEGAAEQASLCDIVSQVRSEGIRSRRGRSPEPSGAGDLDALALRLEFGVEVWGDGSVHSERVAWADTKTFCRWVAEQLRAHRCEVDAYAVREAESRVGAWKGLAERYRAERDSLKGELEAEREATERAKNNFRERTEDLIRAEAKLSETEGLLAYLGGRLVIDTSERNDCVPTREEFDAAILLIEESGERSSVPEDVAALAKFVEEYGNTFDNRSVRREFAARLRKLRPAAVGEEDLHLIQQVAKLLADQRPSGTDCLETKLAEGLRSFASRLSEAHANAKA